MKSPFAQLEKSRVANVTIAKSRVLAALVLRILSRKGFGTFFKDLSIFGRMIRPPMFGKRSVMDSQERRQHSVCDLDRSQGRFSGGTRKQGRQAWLRSTSV
jgi:hypothetical protein